MPSSRFTASWIFPLLIYIHKFKYGWLENLIILISNVNLYTFFFHCRPQTAAAGNLNLNSTFTQISSSTKATTTVMVVPTDKSRWWRWCWWDPTDVIEGRTRGKKFNLFPSPHLFWSASLLLQANCSCSNSKKMLEKILRDEETKIKLERKKHATLLDGRRRRQLYVNERGKMKKAKREKVIHRRLHCMWWICLLSFNLTSSLFF